jgi:predicted alpha/beta-hydrolase family hydrolase
LVLGHGAGGDVGSVDLVAVRDAAVAAGVLVVRVTQPYRVAGRRAPAPAGQLDAAWIDVVRALPEFGLPAGVLLPGDVPLLVGGRSSGARVACRTARALGAVGIVALAFPLHPPGRPDRSRAGELETGLPTLVVGGDRDPFGVPPQRGSVEVCLRPGEGHELRRDPPAVGRAVVAWLIRHGWARG